MLSDTNKLGIRNSIKQWSQRKNIPDDVLDDFIEISLSKSNRALRIPPLETVAPIPVDANGILAIPNNYIEVKELSVPLRGINYPLERKAIHEVDVKNTESGSPCFFARQGNTFQISPWNLGDEELAYLYYWFALPPLIEDTDTNWFTLYSPDTLLYGALSELSDYTRDSEGTQLWTGKWTESINILQAVEDGAEWAGSTLGLSLAGSTRPRNIQEYNW